MIQREGENDTQSYGMSPMATVVTQNRCEVEFDVDHQEHGR